MNIALRLVDYFALSPLFIILITALIVLLVETFSEKIARKGCFLLTLVGLLAALFAAGLAPSSDHPLLTPWLRFDHLSHFFTVLFLSIGIGAACLADSFFQRFRATRGEYFFLLLSSLFGLILIGSAADFLILFLGLEILSIALYVLCGYMKNWNFSHESAIKYFLIGSVATAFLLYGIALIYGAVGTTQFKLLLESYQALNLASDRALFLGGIAFITVGLAFKAAIVPFHAWAPDVYDGAPTPVTAFMAVGTKAGAFAAFAIIFLVALPQFHPLWNQLIMGLSIITLIYANVVALRQVQLRRFFAYSGISHAGFLLIPIIVNTPSAIVSLNFYLVVYSLATFGAFAVLSMLDHDEKGIFISDLKGFFHQSPWLAGIFTLCLLTLAGVPPTAGFFAKFYAFKIAFQSGYHLVVIIGLLTTILSIFYYLRIIGMMFTEKTSASKPYFYNGPAVFLGLLSFVLLLVISIDSEFLLHLLNY